MMLRKSTELTLGNEDDWQRGTPSPSIIPVAEAEIDELLKHNRLFNVFQPIVRAGQAGETIFAYESLARVAGGGLMNDPEFLFRCAEQQQRLFELELTCVENTFRTMERVRANARIFVNVHPHVLSLDDRFCRAIFQSAEKYCIRLDRFVFEITEQGELRGDHATLASIARMHELGAAFAFDDVGIAYIHLRHFPAVRPQFLKISQQFGTGFETDTFRRKIVRNIASLAEDLGVQTILEGVESRSTADAAREMGITLMQGYLFGRPASLIGDVN
ncbi:MAG TPA: EAL domain-containing protein [Thermoanaerobaculia bacterium]